MPREWRNLHLNGRQSHKKILIMGTLITNINQLDLNASYTYSDYIQWKIEERLELIKGKIFKMSPAPNVKHQRISGNIFSEVSWFLKNSSCQIFSAPFDVRLPLPKNKQKGNKIDTVVQPDICIICDPNKLDLQGCVGAPDLIVEILSPGNSKKEMRDKFDLYQESGVKEYWVVFGEEELLQRYILNKKGIYEAQKPNVEGDEVNITFLPEFSVKVDELFR
jgi:Uma2 family endonuclease